MELYQSQIPEFANKVNEFFEQYFDMTNSIVNFNSKKNKKGEKGATKKKKKKEGLKIYQIMRAAFNDDGSI